MNKKKIIPILLILVVFIVITGCGAEAPNSTSDMGGAEPSSPSRGSEADNNENDEHLAGSPGQEKIITSIYIQMETTDFENSQVKLEELMSKYEAYIQASNISYGNYYDGRLMKYGEYTLRVPQANYLSFRTEVKTIGNLLSENEGNEDVTKRYNDLESRLNVVTIKEERLLSLLERAENIEDIITLEDQLSEVIYEKESLVSSLKEVDDKVDFSTVRLTLREVARLRTTEDIKTSFLTRISNAFKDSFQGFKNTLEETSIFLIHLLPYIIIFAILAFLIRKGYKRFHKPKNKD